MLVRNSNSNGLIHAFTETDLAIPHLPFGKEVCRIRHRRGRMIPHAFFPASTPPPLGNAMFHPSIRGPTVPTTNAPKAQHPGLR